MMNMNTRTCFDILHVSRDATLDEAKESYKRLVKLWHPDQYANLPNKQIIAQDKLKEINVAYRDVVTILRNNPVKSETSFGVKNTIRQEEENPQNRKKKGRALWNQVARFIDNNLLKSNRFEDPERNSSPSFDTVERRGAASAGGGDGTVPDFQQALKRAVHKKRLRGNTRQRHLNRGRIRRKCVNEASYRIRTTTRRSVGDRIEKITPVGRVNRIGGD